jgi:LL-H family phage holin
MLSSILSPTVITDIILALLPFIATLAYYFCRLIEQSLPKNQANMLDRVVLHAVQMVEQRYPDAGGVAKKKLAENIISTLLKSFGLPVPSAAAIDAALEATVFQLQQMPSVMAAKQAKVVVTVGQTSGAVPQNGGPTQVPVSSVGSAGYTAMGGDAGDATSAALRAWSAPVSPPMPNVGAPMNVYPGNAANQPNMWGTGNSL